MSDEVIRREGCTYVCAVPTAMGAVTKLEVKRGKLIARTESGHTMILPVQPAGSVTERLPGWQKPL